MLDGDRVEQTGDRQSGRELMTQVANQSIVLLKNEGGILPLKPKERGLKKIAIVGGNAKATVLSGGGSAALKPSFFVSPYEGIVSALGKVDPNVEITYSEGARGTLLFTFVIWLTDDAEQPTCRCPLSRTNLRPKTANLDGRATSIRTKATIA